MVGGDADGKRKLLSQDDTAGVRVLIPYARGGSKGGCYRRKDGDGEVQDFLPNVFVHF